MKFIKWLLSGEVLFAGFLFSSVFKGFFDNTFIDFTLIFMVLSVLVAAMRLLSNPTIEKRSLIVIALYSFMGALMLVSLLYSSSSIYAGDKMFRILSTTAWSFLGGFLLIRSRKSLQSLLKGLLFFGILTSIYTLYDFLSSDVAQHVRFGIDGENVLGLGRLAGVTSIIIASMFFYSRTKGFGKTVIALIGFCITVAVLLLTGSRMPFLSLVIALSFLIPLSFSFNNLRDIKISKKVFPFVFIMSLAFLALIPLYLNGFFNAMFGRLETLFSRGGTSVFGRTDRFDVALDMWQSSPLLGKGIGSFSTYYNNMDIRSYPHNIFLEFASEFGTVGLVLFLSMLLYSIVSIFKVSKQKINTEQVAIILIFVYLLINANSTGDINDNRMLFTFIALTCMLPAYQKEANELEVEQVKEPKEKKRYKLVW